MYHVVKLYVLFSHDAGLHERKNVKKDFSKKGKKERNDLIGPVISRSFVKLYVN